MNLNAHDWLCDDERTPADDAWLILKLAIMAAEAGNPDYLLDMLERGAVTRERLLELPDTITNTSGVKLSTAPAKDVIRIMDAAQAARAAIEEAQRSLFA